MVAEKTAFKPGGPGDFIVGSSGAATRVVVLPEITQTETPPPSWLAQPPLSMDAREDPAGWYQRALHDDGEIPGVNAQRLAVKSLSAHEREETRAFSRHTLDRTDGRIPALALPADQYTWAAPEWSVMIKADQRVVGHAGILYRVVLVDGQRVAVGGIGSVMTLPAWRGRGYARAALTKAQAFIAMWLWAPFALVICPRAEAAFYRRVGWQIVDVPITCAQPGGPVTLSNEVVAFLPCQGDTRWPSGPIDLCGAPW
jgi:GNAT superfamily N-acetyltransferase